MNILTLCDNINLQPKIKSQVVSFSNSFNYIAVIKQLNDFKYYHESVKLNIQNQLKVRIFRRKIGYSNSPIR